MSKPKAEIKQKEYKQEVRRFYQVLSKLGGEKQIRGLLAELLTSSEQRMLHRRWHVASLLAEGLNVREVARQAKVSTLTVMKIKKLLENSSGGSLRQAVKAGQEKAPAKRVTKRRLRQASSRLTFGGVEEASE